MKKQLPFICFLMLFNMTLNAQILTINEVIYADGLLPTLNHISTCKDGSFICTGYRYGSSFTADQSRGWYAKFDSTGHKIWGMYFGHDEAMGTGIIELSSGEYFLTGCLDSRHRYTPYAYYAWIGVNGEIIKDGVSGGNSIHCIFKNAIECHDKTIVASGYFSETGVFRFSPDRYIIDSSNYELDGDEVVFPNCLNEKSDGHLMCVGIQKEEGSRHEIYYELDYNLNLTRTPVTGKDSVFIEIVKSCYPTSDGGYMLAGSRRYHNDNIPVKYWYAKRDRSFKLIWEKEIDDHSPIDQDLIPYDGNLFVCVMGDSTRDDLRFLIFNEEGETLFDKVHKTDIRETSVMMTKGVNGDIIIAGNAHLKFYIYKFRPQIPAATAKHYIHFAVYDKTTGMPIQANVKVKSDDGSAKEFNADSTGVIIPLRTGASYIIQIEAIGYQSHADTMVTAKVDTKSEYTVYLPRLEAGSSIVMKHVQFERDAATLKPDSYAELDKLVQFLIAHPEVKIELSGHTDNGGLPKANQTLSEQRVATVKGYLVSKGIAANRITGKGYGGKKPVAPNDTEENKSKNRRVEVKIL